MFGFIKKLFGGIFTFLGGLFSGKKSQDAQLGAPKARKASGYYMQIEEAEDNQQAAPQKPSSQPVAEAKKPEPAKAEATANAAPAQPAKAEPVAAAKTPEPTPAPATAATNGKVPQTPSDVTFAPKYLNPVTSSNSRRRPGPSLNNYLDMARQVRTPNA